MKATRLSLNAPGYVVPAVLYEPDRTVSACPVLLAQHGGSSHKEGSDIESLVARYVPLGFAVLAVDGPVHGDRRPDGPQSAPREKVRDDFFQVWRSDGSGIECMVQSWTAALEWIRSQQHLDHQQIFWYGVSMGTAYGVPFLSRIQGVKAALLGMWGLCFDNSTQLGDMAAAIDIPVLFQVKWADELFTRQGQIELFDRIGSEQKWLYVYPGMHVPVVGRQAEDACRFLIEQMNVTST